MQTIREEDINTHNNLLMNQPAALTDSCGDERSSIDDIGALATSSPAQVRLLLDSEEGFETNNDKSGNKPTIASSSAGLTNPASNPMMHMSLDEAGDSSG